MRRRLVKIIPLFLFSLLLEVCSTLTALGAGPHIILIHGKPLSNPIILADWNENVQLLASLENNELIKSEDLVGRPYLELSLYWGPEWYQYVNDAKPLNELRPETATQTGRLYLATATEAPAISLNDLYAKKLGSESLSILRQHGVPVDASTSSSRFLLPTIRSLSISFSLVGLFVILYLATRNRVLWRTRTKP